MENKGPDPIAMLTVTKPYNTVEFECFYCKERMTKVNYTYIRSDNSTLIEIQCINHGVTVVRI